MLHTCMSLPEEKSTHVQYNSKWNAKQELTRESWALGGLSSGQYSACSEGDAAQGCLVIHTKQVLRGVLSHVLGKIVEYQTKKP